MKANSVARLAIFVCLLTAVVETVLGCTSTSSLTPGDVFVIGPYLLLALFAWRHRSQLAALWRLLAIAVSLSAWGLYLFAKDSYRYHTEPEHRMVQRMTVFFVPLLQWTVVLLVGLVLLVRWLGRRRADRGDTLIPCN